MGDKEEEVVDVVVVGEADEVASAAGATTFQGCCVE